MNEKIKNIYVFGLGAAGSNVLLNLFYSFPDINYHLVDFDIVERRNIVMGTQPYTKADLNRPKAQAMLKMCKTIALSKANIAIYCKKITSIEDVISIVDKDSLIIDCFDNAESRNIFCDLDSVDIVHVGFSGDFSGAVLWNKNFSKMKTSESDAAIDICEFSLARAFIMTLTGLASMSITNYLNKDIKENFILSSKSKILSW